MVLAQHGLIGREMQTPVDVSYLADSVLLLRFFETKGEVKQAISMIKKCSGHHEQMCIRDRPFAEGTLIAWIARHILFRALLFSSCCAVCMLPKALPAITAARNIGGSIFP